MAKPRPALVLQSDAFPAEHSVTVCPITSDPRSAEAPLLRVPLPATAATGLRQDSWAMADKITTVRATALASRIGQAPTSTMARLSRAAANFLGLAG
jgi:mRNA interferase MazF